MLILQNFRFLFLASTTFADSSLISKIIKDYKDKD